MPAGSLLTDPLPVPPVTTVNAYWFNVKLAVTNLAAFMVTTQSPVPVQAPLQPLKVEPISAVAVSVTTVP